MVMMSQKMFAVACAKQELMLSMFTTPIITGMQKWQGHAVTQPVRPVVIANVKPEQGNDAHSS